MHNFLVDLIVSFLPMFRYSLYLIFAGYFLAVVPYALLQSITRRK